LLDLANGRKVIVNVLVLDLKAQVAQKNGRAALGRSKGAANWTVSGLNGRTQVGVGHFRRAAKVGSGFNKD